MIVFGVTQGMQPILGFNYGAGKWDRVQKTLKKGILAGFCITTFGWIITELFPDAISSMFTTDRQLTAIANTGFRIFFLFYPIVGCQIVIQNYFQSIGKPAVSIFLSLTRQLIFLLPFLWFLPKMWGIEGVWASICGADILAFAVSVTTLIIITRRQKSSLLQRHG
jgi:Na+-driven multidrug efflux pump